MLGFGPFEVHLGARQLRRDGRPLALRERGFELLLALLEQPGQVVSKRQLCERAWPGTNVDENNLQVEISALRKLLGARAIVTVHGRGYQFALKLHDGVLALPPLELIGRDADLAALEALLAPGRLVTVVGEAGVGKSRLVQALVQTRPGPLGGVAFVDLDDVHNREQVSVAIDAALRSAPSSGPTSLVLDGCEPVLQTVAERLIALMAERPRLALLASSRAVLHIPGERVYRLAPLALNPPSANSAGKHSAAPDTCAAMALFMRHVEPPSSDRDPPIARSDFELEAAFDLCRALGGNPLAIALAARHASVLGLVELRDRFNAAPDRLTLLDGNEATAAPARHRSLRAALAWGDAWLAPAEESVFIALAALPQPFTLEAALALPPALALTRWDAVEALGRLVDQSLLAIDAGEPPRYRLTALMQMHAASKRQARQPADKR